MIGALSNDRLSRGISLVELLVSVTILALATTVALVVYDQARLAYKHGENVTEQQQVARIAFDIVSSDIRMAGFNANPDGNRIRPDEQIEAAFDTAITVRADFDADDPVDADLPEQSLGGSGAAFLAVSTGNDEIVSYVLAKPDGSSGETLSFNADVGDTVRDGTVETVDIGLVDLAQNDPPYTLYKLVLENDSSGCCGTNFARRIPIVDNVRSMRFRYFDRAGNPIAAPGGGEAASERAARAQIRRVAIEIEALTRDSDPHWHDPDDTDPDTQQFRKFNLQGEIAPPNLGRAALRDLQADVTPPGTPAPPWLYPGHCGGLYVDWPANPPNDDVAYYRVIYGTDPGAMTGVRSSKQPGVYIGGLAHATNYHVAVEAVDASGNRSPASSAPNTTTTNTTTPEETLSLTASENLTDKTIDLTWVQTTDNIPPDVTGDPAAPALRDLAGYRVYRSGWSGFTPSAGNRIADEYDVGALAAPTYEDGGFNACQLQYYKVRAVDSCGLEGAETGFASAQISTTVKPRAPLDVQAFTDSAGVRLIWSPVKHRTDGTQTLIDEYQIWRSPEQSFHIDDPASWSELVKVPGNVTEYLDPVSFSPGMTRHYLISALDSCTPIPNESVISDHGNPRCEFSGRVVLHSPDDGQSIWGPTSVHVEVQGADASANNLKCEIYRTKVDIDDTRGPVEIFGGSDWWTITWNAHPATFPVGFYEGEFLLTAKVTQDYAGQICTQESTVRVFIEN